MAFFEQIGRRISDAGQGVAQQTRNLTDTTRLNSLISEKKKKISKLLWELGQDYYHKHKRDVSCEEQDYISQINTLLAEISIHKEEINQIKGVGTCPECGAELPSNAAFCTSCGTKVALRKIASETLGEDIRRCPTCGAEAGEDNLFCNYCGTKLD